MRSNDIRRKNSVGEIPSTSRRAAARLRNRETETEMRREREILIALTREERLLGEVRPTKLERESKRMLELARHHEASQQKRESQKELNNLVSPKRCCASVERGVRGSVGNSGERVLREMLEAAKARERALVMEVARIQADHERLLAAQKENTSRSKYTSHSPQHSDSKEAFCRERNDRDKEKLQQQLQDTRRQLDVVMGSVRSRLSDVELQLSQRFLAAQAPLEKIEKASRQVRAAALVQHAHHTADGNQVAALFWNSLLDELDSGVVELCCTLSFATTASVTSSAFPEPTRRAVDAACNACCASSSNRNKSIGSDGRKVADKVAGGGGGHALEGGGGATTATVPAPPPPPPTHCSGCGGASGRTTYQQNSIHMSALRSSSCGGDASNTQSVRAAASSCGGEFVRRRSSSCGGDASNTHSDIHKYAYAYTNEKGGGVYFCGETLRGGIELDTRRKGEGEREREPEMAQEAREASRGVALKSLQQLQQSARVRQQEPEMQQMQQEESPLLPDSRALLQRFRESAACATATSATYCDVPVQRHTREPDRMLGKRGNSGGREVGIREGVRESSDRKGCVEPLSDEGRESHHETEELLQLDIEMMRLQKSLECAASWLK